jgi:hypothetical protein
MSNANQKPTPWVYSDCLTDSPRTLGLGTFSYDEASR